MPASEPRGASGAPAAGQAAAEERRPERLLPLADLAARCHDETAHFLRREPSQDRFGFELFRRALGDRDQRAWAAVYEEYRGLVVAWIRQHPAAASLREPDDYVVNRAFERLWTAVRPERFPSFASLAALLAYLKLCVHSVIQDELRSRATRDEALTEQVDERLAAPDATERAVADLAGRELWQAIRSQARDEAERHVVDCCFVLDLKPREVFQRYPDQYGSVAEVYQAKRNLLDRLRRSAEIRQFLG